MKKHIAILCLLLAVLVLVGCGNGGDSGNSTGTTTEEGQAKETVDRIRPADFVANLNTKLDEGMMRLSAAEDFTKLGEEKEYEQRIIQVQENMRIELVSNHSSGRLISYTIAVSAEGLNDEETLELMRNYMVAGCKTLLPEADADEVIEGIALDEGLDTAFAEEKEHTYTYANVEFFYGNFVQLDSGELICGFEFI